MCLFRGLLSHSLIALCAFSVVSSYAESLAAVQVSQAYVYVPLGAAKTTRGFLVLKNVGNTSVTLVKVKSPIAKKINLMPLVNTAANSTNDGPWSLAPNQTLVMKDKNQFLEFNPLISRISTGDDIELILYFSDGKKQIVIAKAKSAYDEKHSGE